VSEPRATLTGRPARHALALQESPLATCLADSEGRLQFANAAFLRLVGLEADQVASSSLREFEVAKDGDGTIRSVAIGSGGQLVRDGQWRRPTDP
jgi:PAS domain S-box-containing protein